MCSSGSCMNLLLLSSLDRDESDVLCPPNTSQYRHNICIVVSVFFFVFFSNLHLLACHTCLFDTFRINRPSLLYQVVLISINQFDFLEFWIFALLGCWPVLTDLIRSGPRLPHYSLSCGCIDFLFLQQFGLGLVCLRVTSC